MSVFALLRANGSLIGTIGFASALVSALLVWGGMSSAEGDVAIAQQVSNLMIVMAVVSPLVLFGLMYWGRENIGQVKKNTLAIAFGLIGIGGGVFSALVYFFIGFQVPTLFAGADTFVLFDTLVPTLFSTGLIIAITTAIAGVAGGMMLGNAGE